MRLAGTATTLAALAIVASGCLSIKSQSTSQRAAGVISINVAVCASDRDRDIYNDCDPDAPGRNTAETDNGSDATLDALGQLLVGFRVPVGTTSPNSFPSATQDVVFTRSPTYTTALNNQLTKPAGTQWLGYISTPKFFDHNDPAGLQTSFQPEFTLPSQSDGRPFSGPFLWRVVAGIRSIANQGQAGNPVSCGLPALCFDSPPSVVTSLTSAVSDFGVLAGSTATAGHGQTATVAFPIQYLDAGGKGAQNLSFTASTNVPGSTATPSRTTLSAAPGSTNTVIVSVPVPPGTRLGTYNVTLTAATGNPPVTRSNTATITVADRLAPSIRLSTPAEGARFRFRQSVTADYACTEELNGSGLASCSGPVASGAAIDTRSLGNKTFTVNAADRAGNTATASTTYRVVPRPRPRIGVSFDFERFPRFTIFPRMQVKKVPRGSTVTVTCAVKKRKCPGKARRAFKAKRARGTVSLTKQYRGVRIPVGGKIIVRVTKKGTIGAARIITVRSGAAPKTVDRCIRPGSKKLRKKC